MKYSLSWLALFLCMATSGRAGTETGNAETSAGWVKSNSNPVLGGQLGTCFDIAVLRDGEKYRMWFSWRPKKSVALVEGTDGVHWSEPRIALGPNPQSGWEEEINRPVVVKRVEAAGCGTTHLYICVPTKNAYARRCDEVGSATMDASSPHYADQSPLFAAQKFKRPPMTLEDEVKQATRDYRPGKPARS